VSLASRASTLVAASPTGRVAEALAARHEGTSGNPRLRPDVVARRLVHLGEVSWAVKNPETFKVYQFGEDEWGLIELFDGTRTRAEICEEYNRRHPGGNLPLKTVLDYEEGLRKMELLETTGAERNLALIERFKNARKRAAEEKEEGFNIFLIPFHVMDPDRFLNRTVKYVRWLWRPVTVGAAMVVFLLTASVFVARFDTIWRQTIELYSFLHKPFWDFLQFYVIMTLIGAVHEFGHAYAIKINGGDVHDIGFALFYFTPAYYTDSTDAFLFQNKFHRLWVALGGIYIEAYICAIATGLWGITYPDTLVHELAYKTMLYTGVSTVFFNINPMVKTDGYHVLSGYLEMPELREQSLSYLGLLFQKHLLRLPVEVPVYPKRKRRVYAVYGPLAFVYTGAIMTLMGTIFHHVFSLVLSEEIAGPLMVVTMLWVFRKRVRLVWNVARMFYLDKKEFLMAATTRRWLAWAGGAIALLLVLPLFRQTLDYPIVLESGARYRIEAPADAIVTAVSVREADRVGAGDEILRLESPAVTSSLAALTARQKGLERQADARRLSAHPAGAFQAEQEAAAAGAGRRAEEANAARLILRSPVSGRVLTPRLQDLQGRFVSAGALLAEVGDCRQLRAEIPVSERLLSFVAPGQSVSAALTARPFSTIHGRVVAVSPATEAFPTSLGPREDSSLLPPEMPGKFIVDVRFDNPGAALLPGMSGTAKIYTARRSYVARVAGVAWRWLRTVIW
jgi:putative peptide zinc metalloprotease protein